MKISTFVLNYYKVINNPHFCRAKVQAINVVAFFFYNTLPYSPIFWILFFHFKNNLKKKSKVCSMTYLTSSMNKSLFQVSTTSISSSNALFTIQLPLPHVERTILTLGAFCLSYDDVEGGTFSLSNFG